MYAEIKKIRDQVKLLHRDFAPDTEECIKTSEAGKRKANRFPLLVEICSSLYFAVRSGFGFVAGNEE